MQTCKKKKTVFHFSLIVFPFDTRILHNNDFYSFDDDFKKESTKSLSNK